MVILKYKYEYFLFQIQFLLIQNVSVIVLKYYLLKNFFIQTEFLDAVLHGFIEYTRFFRRQLNRTAAF